MIDQPPPQPGHQPVPPLALDRFIETARHQNQKGHQRYGTVLQTWNGRDAGTDAWQEFYDGLVYLAQLEREHADLVGVCRRLADAYHEWAGSRLSFNGKRGPALRSLNEAVDALRRLLPA